MADTPPQPAPPGELVLYTTDDGTSQVQCRFVGDSLWLTQAAIAELYGTRPQNITQHLRNVYEEGELEQEATCKKLLHVQKEGSRLVERERLHYSLDVVLAIGYRVRSARGTQFRQWATGVLSQYLGTGFVIDKHRLENPPVPGLPAPPDHFDELLEQIRDIRASERRMYLRVRTLFALAHDYDPSSTQTRRFFQVMQNKLHFAVSGKTAAELIADRAHHAQPNMGLTSWSGERVTKKDVVVAKNYLTSDEIDGLNRIVSMWLDYAEDQTKRRKAVFMNDWTERLDAFLQFNERDVLVGAGQVSSDSAHNHAHVEYEAFASRRRALLEAQGEADALNALTQSLPSPKDEQ